MNEIDISRFIVRDGDDPEAGLCIAERNTMRELLLDEQSAADFRNNVDRLLGAGLSPPSLGRALDWLAESYF